MFYLYFWYTSYVSYLEGSSYSKVMSKVLLCIATDDGDAQLITSWLVGVNETKLIEDLIDLFSRHSFCWWVTFIIINIIKFIVIILNIIAKIGITRRREWKKKKKDWYNITSLHLKLTFSWRVEPVSHAPWVLENQKQMIKELTYVF